MRLFTNSEPLGSAHEIGERLHSHLLHDMRAVQLDILLPGAEINPVVWAGSATSIRQATRVTSKT